MSHFNKRHDRISRIRKKDDLENPIDEVVRMFTYYLGRQYNKDYYYTTQDQNSCDLPTVWINGQKVTSLVDYMVGNAIKMIENIEPSVKSQSKATINKKTKLLDQSLLKFDMPELFERMAQFGIEYNPLGNADQGFEVPEDIYRYMEYDYKEYSEIIATTMCEDILLRNGYLEKFKQAFLYTLLGGYVGVENRIENGKQYFDIVLPHNLIVDRAKDDDFNSEARFVGKVDWLNITDIIERYQDSLTIEEIEELKKINMNNLYQLLDLTTHPYATNWASLRSFVGLLIQLVEDLAKHVLDVVDVALIRGLSHIVQRHIANVLIQAFNAARDLIKRPASEERRYADHDVKEDLNFHYGFSLSCAGVIIIRTPPNQ